MKRETKIEDVNELLKRAWKIIKGNYCFEIPDVSYGDEEKLYSSFVKVRIATEAICKYVVIYEGVVREKEAREMVLEKYITNVSKIWSVPYDTISSLRAIQYNCNNMVHLKDKPLNMDSAKDNIFAFQKVIDWFVKGYEKTEIYESEKREFIQNQKGLFPDNSKEYSVKRIEDCNEIKKILDKYHVIILSGMSGIGKTELCRQFKEKIPGNSKIYYIENVQTIKAFISDLPIDIHQDNLTKQKEIEIKEKMLWNIDCKEKEQKEEKRTKYYFILDNYDVENADAILQLTNFIDRIKKKDLTYLYFIITVSLIDDSIKKKELIYPVPCLSEEILLDIFRFYCQHEYDEKLVKNLIKKLGYNIRAVKMIAKYLSLDNSIGPEVFVKKIDQLNEKNPNVLFDKICKVTMNDFDVNNESDQILSLLSLIPYSGVTVGTFKLLTNEIIDSEKLVSLLKKYDELQVINLLDENEGINDRTIISIPPIISDIIYSKAQFDFSENIAQKFIDNLFNEYKDESSQDKLVELKPFMDHLLERALFGSEIRKQQALQKRKPQKNGKENEIILSMKKNSYLIESARYDLLKRLRYYYIFTYNYEQENRVATEMTTILDLSDEKKNRNISAYSDFILGIKYNNFERYDKAIEAFESSIGKYKIIRDEALASIARVMAYYSYSLTGIGNNSEAIRLSKESVNIREKMKEEGWKDDNGLWVSLYNYAKALFGNKEYEKALIECEKALDVCNEYVEDSEIDTIEYKNRRRNYSSPLHLKGQILLEIAHDREDIIKAIDVLEGSKNIRKENGGDIFWIAQIDTFLAEAYEKLADVECEMDNISDAYDHYERAKKLMIDSMMIKKTKWKTEEMVENIKLMENKIEKINRKKDKI